MIEVKDISKVYGEQRAVDHATFSVKKGEIVGLLGPNGAGKSTLMKILTCFIPPTDGDATVCGHSIFDDTLAVRRCIGYLPEHNPLYERADEMIELTGLSPEANKRIGQLSKGYRQRVGLAQAMIHDPQVLILDEPTTGLDPNQLEFIRGVIRNAGKNKAVLLSTHIMQEVEAMCSRAIIMGHGKILADENISGLTANKLTEQFHKLTM